MHSEDRTWRQSVYAAIYFPVGFLLLAIGALTLFIPGETAKMMAEISSLSPQSFLTLLFCFAIYSFISLMFLSIAVPARRRERLRVRAIAGDTSAMPLAIAQPKRQSASEVSDEPVTLQWKRWGKVASITATSEGIVGHHAPRKEVSLEWDEIRLIEQWQATSNRMGYCLYANDDRFIEWRIGKRFSDPVRELVGQRHDALLALVSAHTRLPIRTLVRPLAAPVDALPRLHKIFSILEAFSLTLIIAMWVCATTLIIMAPLTTSKALNIYAAAISIVIGAVPLTQRLRSAHTPNQASANLQPPAVALPPDELVTIRLPFTRQDLINTALLGVLPVSATIPLVRAIQELHTFHFASKADQLIHTILLIYVMNFVLIGVGFLLLAILPYISGTHITQADRLGLRQGRGRRQQYIFWQDIAEFTIERPRGVALGFAVTSATQGISWPANARWAHRPEGASPADVGAQFAAIVAQRAGVQPTARWE